jgi:hypothetical protein
VSLARGAIKETVSTEETEMEGSGRRCTTWGSALHVAVLGSLLASLFASLIWLVLLQGDPGTILTVCSRADVPQHCDPWLNRTFTGTGTAEECEWFHYGPWQKPCCYHDPRDGLASDDLCDPNLVSPADQKSCRTGSRKPEVQIDGDKCTISIKDPDSRDVGHYEGSMPYKSKQPHVKLDVDYEDICAYTVELTCHGMWWSILFACCLPVCLLAVTILIIFRMKIFTCCYQYSTVQQDQGPVAGQIEMREESVNQNIH